MFSGDRTDTSHAMKALQATRTYVSACGRSYQLYSVILIIYLNILCMDQLTVDDSIVSPNNLCTHFWYEMVIKRTIAFGIEYDIKLLKFSASDQLKHTSFLVKL